MSRSPVAIIAGAGRFPFHVAEEAKREGHRVVAAGLKGWVDPALAGCVDAYEEVVVGQLGHLITWLKSQGAERVVMAGKVTKGIFFDSGVSFDAEALAALSRAHGMSVQALLGAVADRLAEEGMTLLDSSAFLRSHLAAEGVLTKRAPRPNEQGDVQVGVEVAHRLATLDVGQTVVVKDRVVIAVEALEGTDAVIRRAHTLAGGGLVVVKTAAQNQDRRFDLPVVGLETIATLRTCGATCLAIEAGSALLLEREALVAQANAADLCLVGIPPDRGP